MCGLESKHCVGAQLLHIASMYRFCVHLYVAKMYISAYMNLGVHIHTKDELTESNIGIAMVIFR